MSGDFVDTNVIVYSLDDADPRKRDIARDVIDRALLNGEALISFQVVQEVLNTLSRKFSTPTTPIDARRVLDDVLVPLWRVMPSEHLYHRALGVAGRYDYGFYDSLILAAALTAGCSRVLSEDLQHGQRIEGLLIHNPFA